MAYNRVAAEDLAVFRSIVGEDRCLSGDKILPDYGHDELGGIHSMPDVLLRVTSTEEVSSVMKHCYKRNIPVVVRGSGTGLVGASVAVEHGVMLETTAMNKIVELDRDNLTVTVQPGILLMELTEYVQGQGFFYPPDPGEKTATIGGNISTNAGGMRAVKYGVTRDYVRGLTVVMPDGEIMTLGGSVVKNSSGYSLKDLVVGSEGTLAVVTEAVLKLLPLPKYTVSLLVPFPEMDKALAAVPELLRSDVSPVALEYMGQETIRCAEAYLGKKFPDHQHPAYLLMTFDGRDEKTVAVEYDRAAELCLSLGATDVLIVDTEERKSSVWTARGAFLNAIKGSTDLMDECDVVVPKSRIADFFRYVETVSRDTGLRIPSFGHAGDGNLHIYICRDGLAEDVWQEKLSAAFSAMYSEAAKMGGFVSGEHGIGYGKRGYLASQMGEEYVALLRRIKAAFDPKGILNPGKIFEA